MKAVKAIKKVTAGKAKALNKADRIGPGIGKPTTSRDKSGNRIVVETMTGKKVTGKKKNMRDTAQIIERRAKGDKVRGTSDFKYPSKNYFKKIKEKAPKVPVKRRGR